MYEITLLQLASMCWAILGPTTQNPPLMRSYVVGPTMGQQQYFIYWNLSVWPMSARLDCRFVNNFNHYTTLAERLIAIWEALYDDDLWLLRLWWWANMMNCLTILFITRNHKANIILVHVLKTLFSNGIHSLEARTNHVGESINISKYLKTVSITICVLLRLAC